MASALLVAEQWTCVEWFSTGLGWASYCLSVTPLQRTSSKTKLGGREGALATRIVAGWVTHC